MQRIYRLSLCLSVLLSCEGQALAGPLLGSHDLGTLQDGAPADPPQSIVADFADENQSASPLADRHAWTRDDFPVLQDRSANTLLLVQGYPSDSLSMLQNPFAQWSDSGVIGGVGGRGLAATPASIGSSVSSGGIMILRWQAAVPQIGGATPAGAIASAAAAAPFAGGPTLGGIGVGAGPAAGMALTGPIGSGFNLDPGSGSDLGFYPAPLVPPLPWPGDSAVPGGGGLPDGGLPGGDIPSDGGIPGGSAPDPFPPPVSVVAAPEPSSLTIFAAGVVFFLVRWRRGQRTAGSN